MASITLWPSPMLLGSNWRDLKTWQIWINIYYHVSCEGIHRLRRGSKESRPPTVQLSFTVWLDWSERHLETKSQTRKHAGLQMQPNILQYSAGCWLLWLLLHYLFRDGRGELWDSEILCLGAAELRWTENVLTFSQLPSSHVDFDE